MNYKALTPELVEIITMNMRGHMDSQKLEAFLRSLDELLLVVNSELDI